MKESNSNGTDGGAAPKPPLLAAGAFGGTEWGCLPFGRTKEKTRRRINFFLA